MNHVTMPRPVSFYIILRVLLLYVEPALPAVTVDTVDVHLQDGTEVYLYYYMMGEIREPGSSTRLGE